ncbi:MAG TPA: glycoside hydrolase family 97 N-terminal domain-containing protein, partial [Isosphaeraceae bacterium]
MTPPSVRPLPVTALFVLAWTATAWTQEEPVRVTSPDGQVEIQIAAAPALTYRVSYRGQPVILDSALGLEFEGQPPLAAGLTRVSATSGGADQAYRVVAGKANPMRDHHRSARVEFREAGGAGRRLGIEARAFDD